MPHRATGDERDVRCEVVWRGLPMCLCGVRMCRGTAVRSYDGSVYVKTDG